MYLGGKTRNAKDQVTLQGRRQAAAKGREIIRQFREEASAVLLEVPMLELLDSTPSEGDLLVSGAFNQKINFDY
ncbi:hypothetical protein PP747_gp055 [Rhizobium phage RHph_Y38]|uniref:Uncharacterized protein n=2 Tax=Acanvirus TaxID=3044653 RepID=A0A7S5R285_9CAUD|nr:hypothetical protein PP747_gp055 [Rhizobium phage RHph_Y38]YP_010658263.1 hypothetical protein PP749_gp052 [Rhizobium phage RHEph22]QIG67756.1 hypothetical protein EVB52_055 [Rhizobium phage RHph_Y38]QXV74725.1 hypothetical protein [Rhizobium phage RHEph22]QXV74820.1 hypothetical protein [Rhizobium phage RHEph24]